VTGAIVGARSARQVDG